MYLKWLRAYQLLIIDEVDSTNSEAKRIACAGGVPDHMVIWAKKQLSGKGRYGRTWISDENNLCMSIVIPVTKDLDTMSQISFVAAVAVYDAIDSICKEYNVDLLISHKWPNDILLNHKKVSGILLETCGRYNQHLIIGIGVNVATCPALLDTATSLRGNGLHFVDVADLLSRIMNCFMHYYALWNSYDFSGIRLFWLKNATHLGEVITVNFGHNSVSGVFVDIDNNGAIMLRLTNGEMLSISTGEIFNMNVR
jgi:BirA family biotin operon repressor/biotin-[acetyl-CoA-carboxylase] ligase